MAEAPVHHAHRPAPASADPKLAEKVRAAGIAVAPAPAPAPKTEATAKVETPADGFAPAPASLLADEATLRKTAPRWQRKPEQLNMDNIVKQAHERWIKAGKPSQWGAMAAKGVVMTYFSDVDKSHALRQLVNRASALHEVRVRWGTSFILTEGFVKSQQARGVDIPDSQIGKEVLSFAILDKRPDNLSPEKRKDALDRARATREANKKK